MTLLYALQYFCTQALSLFLQAAEENTSSDVFSFRPGSTNNHCIHDPCDSSVTSLMGSSPTPDRLGSQVRSRKLKVDITLTITAYIQSPATFVTPTSILSVNIPGSNGTGDVPMVCELQDDDFHLTVVSRYTLTILLPRYSV